MKRFMVSFTRLSRVVFTFGAAALLGSLPLPARAVTIDWVTVGDPGNANDPATGNLYGAVNYEYQIGKYEVTIQQYADFLNAVAASDPYSLYSTSMASNLNIAGISRSGSSGSYAYTVISPSGTTPVGASSPGNRPITYVSWFDSARFTNWMQNGQGSGSTETGAYTLVDGQISGTAPAKNPGATFYIPLENEWYKVAYYSPVLNFGSGGYYTYATQSDTAPGNVIGSGTNQANYQWYGFAVKPEYVSDQNYLTDMGAFTNSASYYGTFDQSGNVYEWNDLTGAVGSSRGLRGGYWRHNGGPQSVSSSNRLALDASYKDENGAGFRLAAPVPEPSTYAMALAGLACGGYSMWRRRKRVSSYRLLLLAAIVTVTVATAATPVFAQSVNYELVPVGDAGNANDPATGGIYGGVAYDYQIGKYDVTIGQYAAFLNAVAATDTYSLYSASMATDLNIAGISRTGSPSSYTYSVINNGGNSANRPITLVSWYDAARFANWMANGQPTGAQISTTTENGAYNVNGATTGSAPGKNVTNPNTSAVPTFYIPTENEWYKAAYYSPVKGGVGSPGYYAYATQSDSAPGNTIGGGANQANYNNGVFSVAQSGVYSPSQYYLTDVGAFTNSESFYGTFDQSGNVYQWNDLDGLASSGSSRGMRGGAWSSDAFRQSSSFSYPYDPSMEFFTGTGFRLAAAVPEPSTCAMALAGLACGGYSMWRRRKGA